MAFTFAGVANFAMLSSRDIIYAVAFIATVVLVDSIYPTTYESFAVMVVIFVLIN